ncbi:MAG TPA: HAMP domain-containing sensor histidine kinase [Cellulomonas sp.]
MVVVGVVLLVGALFAQRYLDRSLLTEERAAAQARADAIATQLDQGADVLTLVDLDEDDELVQVLDGGGDVVAASATARGLTSLGDVSGDRVSVHERDDDGDPEDRAEEDVDAQVFVLARADVDDDAPYAGGGTVVVGRSLAGAQTVSFAVTVLLLVGVPGVLALVAGTTWWLVGRALRPVEQMRERADAISHTTLGVRLPEPGGDDEVARLARTLNSMLDRLDTSTIARRRFVSDASHELRSPIAVVRQNADLVLTYPGRVDAAELTRGILAEAERMQHLVDGLLLLARSDEQRLRVTRSGEVDLDDLLLAEAGRLHATTALRVDTSGVTATPVLGDGALLGQVVRNLVDNAGRHARTRVAVSCRAEDPREGGGAMIDVDDDGAGIPPADRERVFDRFVRLDDARARDAGGSGLGLAIVREIVGLHHGTVQVLDAPGGGARLRVVLPVGTPRA